MCNCCEACHARGASEAKHIAATAIGEVFGFPIDGSTPNERFDNAITIVRTMFGLTKKKALGRAHARYPYLQRSF